MAHIIIIKPQFTRQNNYIDTMCMSDYGKRIWGPQCTETGHKLLPSPSPILGGSRGQNLCPNKVLSELIWRPGAWPGKQVIEGAKLQATRVCWRPSSKAAIAGNKTNRRANQTETKEIEALKNSEDLEAIFPGEKHGLGQNSVLYTSVSQHRGNNRKPRAVS